MQGTVFWKTGLRNTELETPHSFQRGRKIYIFTQNYKLLEQNVWGKAVVLGDWNLEEKNDSNNWNNLLLITMQLELHYHSTIFYFSNYHRSHIATYSNTIYVVFMLDTLLHDTSLPLDDPTTPIFLSDLEENYVMYLVPRYASKNNKCGDQFEPMQHCFQVFKF